VEMKSQCSEVPASPPTSYICFDFLSTDISTQCEEMSVLCITDHKYVCVCVFTIHFFECTEYIYMCVCVSCLTCVVCGLVYTLGMFITVFGRPNEVGIAPVCTLWVLGRKYYVPTQLFIIVVLLGKNVPVCACTIAERIPRHSHHCTQSYQPL
jgi:hypothetical protein